MNTRVFGSLLTHGNSADCPNVRAGAWSRCHGHVEPLTEPEPVGDAREPESVRHFVGVPPGVDPRAGYVYVAPNTAKIQRAALLASMATRIMEASATKTRDARGVQNVTFLPPKECAEMAAELWMEASEASRAMDD